MRTDSPTDTSTSFLAGLKSFILTSLSFSPIVVGAHVDNLHENLLDSRGSHPWLFHVAPSGLRRLCRIRLGCSLSHEVTRVRDALLTDVGEPFEGNGDTDEVLGVVLDTYDSGRGFE